MNPGVYKIVSLNYNQESASPVEREVGRIMVNDLQQIELLEDRHGIIARLFATDPSNAKINLERMTRSSYWKVVPLHGQMPEDTDEANVDGWKNQQMVGDVVS